MAEATSKMEILVTLRDMATDAMRRMGSAVEDLGGSLGFAGDKSGILAGGLAAIGGATILKSIQAFESSQATLLRAEGIFKGLPDGIKKFQEAMRAADEIQRQFGFDNEEVTLALAKFARASGGDMQKAMLALQAAVGLSIERFGGAAGLNQAVQALLPTFANGGRAVRSLGFELDEKASAVTAFQTVVNATKTETESWAKSLERDKAVLKSYGSDILESMGKPYATLLQLLPQTIGAHIDLGNVLKALDPFIQGLGISIGIVSAALTLKAIPALLTTIARMIGFNIVAGLTWAAIGTGILTIGAWVIAIGLVIGAVILLIKHWDQAKKFLSETWNFLRDAFNSAWGAIISTINSAISAFNNLFSAASRAISAAGNIAGGAFSSVRGLLGLQHGGIVTRPTLAMVGEAGAEAVIPLSRFGGAGIGGAINIYLQGDFYTDAEVAERFANKIANLIKFQLKL